MAGGFSLHAGTVAGADERSKLERLCRYISRPALARTRLSLTPSGNVRYHFKTPWRDGTTHLVFEPLDFIACIEDRAVIETILAHLRRASLSASGAAEARGPRPRAPPSTSPSG